MKLARGMVAGIAATALVSMPVFAQEQGFSLELNGMASSFSVEPVELGGEVRVDGREFARLFGAQANFNDDELSLTIRLGDISATYRDGNTVYYLNGQRRFLRTPVVASDETGGTLLLPLRQVAGVFGGSARVEGSLVSIIAPSNEIILVPSLEPLNGAEVISLDQAFQLAQRNNSSIDAINDSITFMEQQRRSVVIDFDNAWWRGMDQTVTQLSRTIRSIDQSIGSAGDNTQIIQRASHMMALNAMNALRGQQVDRLLLLENIDLQTENVRIVRLRNEMGLASDNDLSQAERDLAASRATLRSIELSIANQRAALNNILGLPSNSNTYISSEINIVDPDNSISQRFTNFEQHAQASARNNPSVGVLRRQLEVAQLNYDTARPSIQSINVGNNLQTNATDRANMLNALNNAARALDDRIGAIEQAMRDTYGQLLVLEAQRAGLDIDLERARQAYNTAVNSLAAGHITEFEVRAARIGIFTQETNIIRNALAYENLLFALENPALLGQ